MADSYERIASSLDRFQEAHFWIHMLERSYHDADPFRWHLNAFMKAIKEVPQILQMELQNEEGFSDWFRTHHQALKDDNLFGVLSKKRDIVVHKKMLVPKTRAALGITEGRDMKLGLSFPVHPLEDSDAAMRRYLHHAAENGDFLGVLIPDDDSLPCVQRRWQLEDHDEEVVELCSQTWLRVGKIIEKVLLWLGEEDVPQLSLGCRHSSQSVQFCLFDREQLIADFESIQSGAT